MAELTVRCQACGRPMVRRTNSKNGSEFLACSGYTERDNHDMPACAETRGLPEHIRMQERGAEPLPGF